MSSSISVLTWNVNFRGPDCLRVLGHRHDVLTLQEVKTTLWPGFRDELRSLGLDHSTYTGEGSSYGNVIASRFPLSEIPTRVTPWPELLAHVIVSTASGPLQVLTVHAPNGAGNGWAKIDTLSDLRRKLVQLEGQALVLTGDFNEPQLTALDSGHVVTWGQTATEKGFTTWERWRSEREGDTGSRWDEEVRWFFEGDLLRHAFLEAHGAVDLPETHVSGGTPRAFDHIFVAGGVSVLECEPVRGSSPEFSDHTAVMAALSIAPS